MSPTLSAADRQSTWAPHWLVEFSTTATPTKFSDIDLDVNGTFYHGRIISDPVVTRYSQEVFWGWTEINEVTFRLANTDNALDAHYDEDPRGSLLVVKRYDADSGTNATEFTGVVSSIAMGDGWIEVQGVSPDLSFLRQRVPTKIVNVVTFGAYAVNLGVRVPVVFGSVDKAPLLYVSDDTVDDQYDYVVSAGTVSVTAVYRPLPTGLLETVEASEYSVSTALYAGYTVIRFPRRQVDFSDNYLAMYADVTGLQAHNPAEAVRMVLASTEYGFLGQTVDETTLVQAIADAEPLVCAGIIQEPREAQDILRQFMLMRGMRLGWTSAGAVTVTVDKEPTTALMVVRDGEGDGERNLLGIVLPRKRKPIHEAVKDVVIRYKPDYFALEPRLEVRRTVRSGFGFDHEIEHDFIRDSGTADRVAYYLAKRAAFDEQVEVELTQEARQLGPGDLVSTDYAALGGIYLEALRVQKMTDRVRVLLGSWSDEFYGYVAGTLPTDHASQTIQNDADIPAVPTGLALATAAETSTADGATTASVTATWTANTEADLQQYLLRLRTSGGSTYVPATSPAGIENATWKSLLTSTQYAVQIRAEDRAGNLSAWSGEATVMSEQDTTAPGAPTTITVRQGGGKVVEIDLQFTEPADWGSVDLYRNTTDASATATLIETKKAKRFHDQNVSYGSTYYYWAKVVDLSGNASGFSPSSGHSVTVAQIVTADLTSANVTTATIAANAATKADLAAVEGISNLTADADLASLTFTVGDADSVAIIWTWTWCSVIDTTGGALTFKLMRGVTTLQSFSVSTTGIISFFYKDTPGAGTFTYKLTVVVPNQSSCTVSYRRLWLVESKR